MGNSPQESAPTTGPETTLADPTVERRVKAKLLDRVMLTLLSIHFLAWVPYKTVFGTKVSYNKLFAQFLVDFGLQPAEIKTSAIYAKMLMYGLLPAVGIAGAVSLLMLITRTKNWHLLAIFALFAQTALILLSHQALLSIYEVHGIDVYPNIERRMLYATIAKGAISGSFTAVLTWYLSIRGKRVFGT